MLAIVVALSLFAAPSSTPPVAWRSAPDFHDRVTAETGITFSVLGSIVRRSIVSTDTPYGFAVKAVRAGSRGDRAGLRRGDLVLTWDGRPIRDLESLWGWIEEEESGAEVAIEVARRRPLRSIFDRDPWFRVDLMIRVGRPSLFRETGIEIDWADTWWRRSVREEAYGLKVGLVAPDSPAAEAGIRAGDVLLEWKGRPIVSFAELEEWIDEDLPAGKVEVVFGRRVGGKFALRPWEERRETVRLK